MYRVIISAPLSQYISQAVVSEIVPVETSSQSQVTMETQVQQIHSAATVQLQDWWLHKQGPCFVFRKDLTSIINTSARVLKVVTREC